MVNHKNNQDDESKPVPQENDAESMQNGELPERGENHNEPGHGTVGNTENSGSLDGGSEVDLDATVVGIESMDFQEGGDKAVGDTEGGDREDAGQSPSDGTVVDIDEDDVSSESGDVDVDLDATVVGLDPTAGVDLKQAEEAATKSVESEEGREVADFDPNATLEELDVTTTEESGENQPSMIDKATQAQADDGEADVDLDATVNDLDATFLTDDQAGSDVQSQSGNAGSSSEDIDKTVMEGEIDQTVMTGPEVDDQPMIRPGTGGKEADGRGKVESTIRDAQEATYDGYDSNPSVQTVDSSVLESDEIGKTINPRELSDEEASAWSLAGQGEVPPSGKTVVSGSGPRRTWVDYQFSRLRQRTVSEVKGQQNTDDDYRLVRKLGQGGMGDVFVARQGSLNRLLALKLIKPLDGERRAQLERLGKLKSVEEERRQQFLSEAIVTGDLDHPNIVPIHDVAVTKGNELFYSMKRVVGTPWSKVIKKNSREENLEILMKSCDAIGFAHERGVVHRDIKPENIMLGDFGVVMVMDWGLALPTASYDKHDSIFATSGLGGTPAFMAPEMVTGPLEKIGPASDVYLLGATLFMIVTGSAPHKAKSVAECLKSVRRNTIRKVSEAEQGELLDIAMRAMATKPEDRYPDVASFQNDIRAYREHAESISLTVRATEDLEFGQQEASYESLSRAAFRYEEALKSWPDNKKAKQGLEKTKLVHAKIACDKGDYEFGLSLLSQDDPTHFALLHELEAAIKLRDSHAARVAVLRKAALAMLAFIIIFGSGALYLINDAKNAALAAKSQEEKAKNAALASQAKEEEAKEEALAAQAKEDEAKEDALAAQAKEEEAKEEALRAEKVALVAKEDALAAQAKEEEAKEEALIARQEAEYEEYISKIALAKARLDRNEADGAREILLDLKSNPNSLGRTQGWEWRWLWRQANQSTAIDSGEAPVVDLAMSTEGHFGAIALADGTVEVLRLGAEQQVVEKGKISSEILGNKQATSVALSSNGHTLAIGTADGSVVVATGLDDMATLMSRSVIITAHKRSISDLCFDNAETLWTASEDRTVRSWKQSSDGAFAEDAVAWHFLPVRQIAVVDKSDGTLLAAVVGDERGGKIVVWQKTETPDGSGLQLLGRMSGHAAMPSAVTFNPTGQLVASGDVSGNVLIWDTTAVSAKGEQEFLNSIQAAVDKSLLTTNATGKTETGTTEVAGRDVKANGDVEVGLSLKDVDLVAGASAVSPAAQGRNSPGVRAHSDAIETIRFSMNGASVLTASDDYTVKIWDLDKGKVRQTLRGHGGWVVGADFVAGQDDMIVSASDDATVRIWNTTTYVGAFKSQRAGEALKASDPRDEIWSASFAPSGEQIVIARGDHKAEIIRVDDDSLAFRQISELSLEEGTDFVAMSMQVDPLHGLLYVGSGDETIRVWDLSRGIQIGSANKTGLNTSFAVSKDGHWMLTGSSDEKTRGILWKLDTSGKSSPELCRRLEGRPGQESASSYAISPDSKTLFAGDDFGIGTLWDLKTGKQIGEPIINLRGRRINDSVFALDGKSIFIAADNAAVTEIDLQKRQEGIRIQQLGYVVKLSFTEDQKHLLTVCEVASKSYIKTFATLWDVNSGLGQVLDLTVVPRSNDAGVVSRARVTSARFDPSNKTVLVSRTANENDTSEIRVWDLGKLVESNDFKSSQQIKQILSQANQSSNGGRLFIMPPVRGDIEGILPLGSEKLLTMNYNGVFLWNLKSKREEKSYRAHAELTEAGFSFDAKYVATASRSVKIWDAVSGKALAKIESDKPIRTVQFSPVRTGSTGYMFATGGDKGVVEFWEFNPLTREVKPYTDIATENIAEQQPEQPKAVHRIRFSKDGDRLWIVGVQGLACLRHLRNADETIVVEVPEAQTLTCAAISDNGDFLAAGSTAKNVLVWRLPRPGGQMELVTLSGHAGAVNDVGLVGSEVRSLRVFSASQDGTTRVWDPRFAAATTEGEESIGGREIISLRQHEGDVTALDTTLNGDLLMTAGSDGQVVLWPADDPSTEDVIAEP